MGNFDNFLNAGRSEYFQYEKNYENENFIMSSNMMEAINNYGFCFKFYRRTYDTSYDRIWGEQTNSRYDRVFDFMGMYTAPPENKLFTKFGIELTDEVTVYASKLHFRSMSIDVDHREETIPKTGDIVEAFNNCLYEITSIPKVTDFSYFRSSNLIWEFVMKPYSDELYKAEAEINGTTLQRMTQIETDLFDIAGVVEQKKEKVIYIPKPSDGVVQNPFSNW